MGFNTAWCQLHRSKIKNGLRRHNSLHVKSKAPQNMRKSLLVLKNSVFWFFPKRIFSQSWLEKHFFAFIKEVYQDSIRLKMSNSQFGLFYTQSHLLVSRSGEKSILGVYEAERKDISTIWEGVRYSRWQISDCGVSAESPPSDSTSISGMDICEIL